MFDLQRFAKNFGLLSKSQSDILEKTFRSVSIDGAMAYFYSTPEPEGEPVDCCCLSAGLLPTVRVTAPEGTEITATFQGNTDIWFKNKIVNAQYCDFALSKVGNWAISDGATIKTITVPLSGDIIQLYPVSF